MVEKLSQKIIVTPLQHRLVSVWMLSPDYVRIRSLLEDRGYTTKGFGRTQALVLGEMGLIRVYSNVERRSLGVTGSTSPKELAKAYSDLIQMNFKELDVDESNIMFHEFAGDYSAKTGSNPLEVMSKLGGQTDLVSKIGKELNVDLSTLSLGFALKGKTPSSNVWESITVRPSFGSSMSTYVITIVFRNKLEEVLKFTRKIEGRIRGILSAVEGR